MTPFRMFVVCGFVAAGAYGAAAGPGDAAKGKQLFQSACAVCHNADSDKRKMGPGLKGLFKLYKLVNGKKPTEANVRSMIDQGGHGMPPYKDTLSGSEKDNLIAFLKTL